MKKLKGSIGAIKMKYLIFVFVAALLAALPTRVYQLLALVDPINGFYNGSDVTIPVLYGALFVFAGLFLVLSFLSKEVPSPKFPVAKNPVLGVASIIMALGLGWDILSIEKAVVPQVQGGINFEIFGNLLSTNISQNGGLFLALRFVFAVFAIFYLVIFAVSHLNGKASYKEYKLLAITPLCWAIASLISRLMTAVSFMKVSELFFEIFMFVFLMLFLLTFARISSGVYTVDSMWGIYGYGFSAALFAGLVTIPRLVCGAVGIPAVEGHAFNFVHFAALIFVLCYVLASLGIGFKDGFKNMRTAAEVDLPDDTEVVIKRSKPSEPTIVEEAISFDDEEIEETEEEIIGEAIEEIEETEEEIIEEVIEETEEITESVVDEVKSSGNPAKAKKEKKSLFGLRKAPERVEEVADDLKPISLADLKKKNQDQ